MVAGQVAVGCCSSVFVSDIHVVQSTMAWGPEKGSFDVFPLIEEGKHVGLGEERCLLCWMWSRRKDALLSAGAESKKMQNSLMSGFPSMVSRISLEVYECAIISASCELTLSVKGT